MEDYKIHRRGSVPGPAKTIYVPLSSENNPSVSYGNETMGGEGRGHTKVRQNELKVKLAPEGIKAQTNDSEKAEETAEKKEGREETTSGERAVICPTHTHTHLWILYTQPQHADMWGIIREW